MKYNSLPVRITQPKVTYFRILEWHIYRLLIDRYGWSIMSPDDFELTFKRQVLEILATRDKDASVILSLNQPERGVYVAGVASYSKALGGFGPSSHTIRVDDFRTSLLDYLVFFRKKT